MNNIPKKIFNQGTDEKFEDAKIIGGNPNGIINYNRTPHQWATSLYKKMLARTWFPDQVNVSKDKVNYSLLTPNEKRMYDLVLAQLIANDSIQTNQLMDSVNRFITSPVVNACLSRQAFDESSHAEGYAIMAEDITNDTDRIYNMHKVDEELQLKNEAVSEMYNSVSNNLIEITDDTIIMKKPTNEDLLMIFVANQILEELVFPGGFVSILSLESKMPGSVEMITEILKDESLSHVPLFMLIFRTCIKESFNGEIPSIVKQQARELIIKMSDAEKRWTKYVTKGLLGFSNQAIDIFVESKANSICSNLGLDLIYENNSNNPLDKLLKKSLRGGEMESRTNFFEANSVEYTKGSLNVNDSWDVL